MSMIGGKLLVMAGFESQLLDSYRTAGSSSGSSISSTRARSGTYSLLCAQQEYVNIPIAYNVSTSITNFGVTFGFFMEDQDTAETPSLFAPGSSTLPWLRIQVVGGNRKLELVNGSNYSNTTVVWTGSQTLALDTWYVISICAWRQSNTYWPYRIKIFSNTLTLLEDSGWQATAGAGTAANPVSAASINSMYFGQAMDSAATAGVHNFHYDDIMITQSSPAPVAKIVGTLPTGDGSDDGFIGEDAGAVTNDNVSDQNDATYATSSGGSSALQTYTHAAVTDPASTGNILAVCGHARAQRDGASNAIGNVRLKTSGGAFVPGTSLTIGTSWLALRGLSTVSQAGAGWTSGTGSETSIDDVQFGMTKVLNHMKVSHCILEVAWGTDWTNSGDYRFFPDKKPLLTGGY